MNRSGYQLKLNLFLSTGWGPLHSLAVEEQFYILFPLLLIAINRFSKSRCLPWLLAITLISFIACIYGSYTNKITAFYLMPTRAWELLFGSIIALGVIPQPSSNIHRNLISILGTGFILFCVAFYTEKTIFPGISALVPVVGASLIIYSGSEGETIISKILSRRPIVFIGLISYSLYLWHWPLIVYVKYLTIGDLTTLEKTSIIILSILISTLSLRFIEQPFRSATSVLQDRKKLFIFSSIVMFIASFIGCTIYLQKGMPYRYPKALLGLEKEMPLEKSVTTIKDCSITKIGAYNFPQSFILWGDSHAGVFVQALDEKAKAFGLSGYSMAKGSTSPVLGMEVSGSNEKGKFTTEVINFISAHKEIKTVIIAGFWTNDIELVDLFEEYPGRQPYLKLFRIGLFRTINKLIKMDRRVVLISDVPTLKDDPYRFPYVAYRLNATPDYKKIAPTINEYKNRNEGVLKIFNELSEINNVTIIHPELLLFDKAGYTIVLNNNQLLYRDSNHLSTYGGKYIGAVFDNEFMQMVKDKSSAR